MNGSVGSNPTPSAILEPRWPIGYDDSMDAISATLFWLALRTLAAMFMVFALVYLSYALARRFFGSDCLSVRWSAASLFGLLLSTMGFHATMWIGQFTLPAGLVLAAAALGVARNLLPLSSFGSGLASDLADLAAGLRRWHGGWIIPAVVFIFAALVIGAKTLLIPPMGWDTLTYHGIKAALWAQGGGPIALDTPAGWSIYRLYFGGAEIIPAWVILPFQSDVLVPFSDWVVCMALGLVAYALGRTLGLPAWTSAMQAFFLLSIPAIHRSAGLVYAEPMIALAMLGSVLFGTLYFRRGDTRALAFSAALLGLMAGMKTLVIPLAAVGVIVLLLAVLFSGDPRRSSSVRWLAGGVLTGLLAALPWVVQNMTLSGCPLSPVPIKVFGVTLGQANDAMKWLMDDANSAFAWKNEWLVLTTLFGTDPINPRLGPFVLPMLLLFPAGLLSLKGKDRWSAAMIGGMALVTLGLFYSSGMTIVRCGWPRSTARFLIPLVVAAVVAAPLAFRRGRAATGCGIVLALLTMIQLQEGLLWGTSGIVLRFAPVIAVLLALFGLGAWGLAKAGKGVLLAAVVIFLPVLVVPALSVFREQTRAEMYGDTRLWMHHPFSRYWSGAAAAVDRPGESYRIAVTAGPWQSADNWFMYPFLGSRLQNRIAYVPVTASGEIVDFIDFPEFVRKCDREAWMKRLHDQSFTHVMSFAPDSVELGWMRRAPALFEEVVAGPTWGLYRVRTFPAGAETADGNR
jgi:hypothetical protein